MQCKETVWHHTHVGPDKTVPVAQALDVQIVQPDPRFAICDIWAVGDKRSRIIRLLLVVDASKMSTCRIARSLRIGETEGTLCPHRDFAILP